MTFVSFALVLIAAFCHAAWNFSVKRVNAGPELVWLFSFVAVVLYAPLAIWIGLGMRGVSLPQLVFLGGTILLHTGYFLLLQHGYRKGDLSLIYPTARSTGPVLSSSFAVLFLGERITPQIALGGLIIIFGVLMLTGGFRRRAQHTALSLGYGLSAGLFIGSYTVWDAYAVSVLLIPPLLMDYVGNAGRAVLLTPLAWRRRAQVRRLWREHRADVLVIAILSPLAYILVLTAMTFTPVVYVAPIREVSVLLSVLAGSLLLGEGYLRHRLIWAAVILTGVTLLAVSR